MIWLGIREVPERRKEWVYRKKKRAYRRVRCQERQLTQNPHPRVDF